jgi:DJ-1/PfpI family
MNELEGKRVAMLAADGFEQSELMVPKQRLEEAGAKVDIISLKTGEIWGWNKDDWGDAIPVDRTIDAVQVDESDALARRPDQSRSTCRRGCRHLRPDFYDAESQSQRFVMPLGF